MTEVYKLLERAVALQNQLTEIGVNIIWEIGGASAFEPYDDKLSEAVLELIFDAWVADNVNTSRRARKARLKLRARDFVFQHTPSSLPSSR